MSRTLPRPEGWPDDMTWPPGQSLDDAFDKLRWAKHHLESLRVEIEPIEQRDSHRISCDVDAQEGKYMFHVHDLEELGEANWSLMIGDCLHNARTALDYLMVRLYALVTGKKPRFVEGIQFPIYDALKRFEGAVAEARKHPQFSGYLARIEELQPFNRGNPSVWGVEQPPVLDEMPSLFPLPVMHALPTALNRLASLDNIDKHRVIHATWLGRKWGRLTMESIADRPSFIPDAFEWIGSSGNLGALKSGAEVGSMEFAAPLPHEWHPDEMDMKRYFPLQVSIADEMRFPGGVLEILGLCIWGVEAVLAIFEPVFTDGAPPLPVTAIPNR